jgi:hypothetical protein
MPPFLYDIWRWKFHISTNRFCKMYGAKKCRQNCHKSLCTSATNAQWMKYKMQTMTVTLPHLTEWLYQKKLLQNKIIIPIIIFSAFSSFPSCPSPCLTSLTSQHRTSIHTNCTCMHHARAHTHTHTPLKTKNLKWLKQCILESTGRNHSQHTTLQMTRNTFKILLFQVTVIPLHKLNTLTL